VKQRRFGKVMKAVGVDESFCRLLEGGKPEYRELFGENWV
jgi:hypothetical protein